MEPTWQSDDGRVRLYHGDCRDVLPHLSGVASVVTSPPYNQLGSRIPSKPSGVHAVRNWVANTNEVGYADDMEEGEYQAWHAEVMRLCADACADNGSLFVNHKCRWRDRVLLHPVQWMQVAGCRLRQDVVWRRGGSTTLNARLFAPNEERILWWVKGDGRWKWNQSAATYMSVWDLGMDNSPGGHPCPFPIALPLRCIEATTDPDDVVLDPFLGSGTTGEASVQLGRRFVGIEKEERFFVMARNAIQESLGMEVKRNGVTQKRMFGQDVNGVVPV